MNKLVQKKFVVVLMIIFVIIIVLLAINGIINRERTIVSNQNYQIDFNPAKNIYSVEVKSSDKSIVDQINSDLNKYNKSQANVFFNYAGVFSGKDLTVIDENTKFYQENDIKKLNDDYQKKQQELKIGPTGYRD